jgi:exodeoxyribonuclease V alpha subunit
MKLRDVPGFGPVLIERIRERWPKELEDSELRDNPYLLTRIHQIGFDRADRVAQLLGIKPTSPFRIQAGAAHVLAEQERMGHCWFPRKPFVSKLEEALRVELPQQMDFGDAIEYEDGMLARRGTASAERSVAESFRNLLRPCEPLAPFEIEAPDGKAPTRMQRDAIDAFRYFRVAALLGGPGTGKTHTLRALIPGVGHVGLCAPTGKAAKRMTELSGMEAKTIHRLLGTGIERSHSIGFEFHYNRKRPLPHDFIIVDESSMVDIRLMADLCEAFQPETRLLLVGDPFQLPAVGPGAILRDLRGTKLPVCELTELHRFEKKLIAPNCQSIRRDHRIVVNNEPEGDFFFIANNDPEQIAREVVSLVVTRLPVAYQYDPMRDIQVITALRESGYCSVKNLNMLLRERLNPKADRGFDVGDRVIQNSNCYSLEVMNGEIGTIVDLNPMTVLFDDDPPREIADKRNDLELSHAWALTVHKFQGSEAKCVIVPIHEEQKTLVPTASWLYTAISRAQERCIVIGSRSALDAAAARHQQMFRYTRLAELINA